MSKLTWDAEGTRYFETGTKNGVLYPYKADGSGYDAGVAWNGLTAVTESPSGAEANDIWADNMKYATLRSAETFGGTIEAYTYPDEFAVCDGSAVIATGVTIGQQARRKFGLSYRTEVGNDVNPELGYKLHLVWGCTASPSEKSYATINDSPEAITFSWEFDTTPVPVTGYKPTATLVIDSTDLDTAGKAALTALEAILYGTDAGDGQTATDPRMPSPAEVIALFTDQG